MLHIKRLVFDYFSTVDYSFDKKIFTTQVIHFHFLSSKKRLFNIFQKWEETNCLNRHVKNSVTSEN